MNNVVEKYTFFKELSFIERIIVLGFVLLYVAVGIVQLAWPLSCDHGSYYWMGDVILAGGEPYIDFWDLKGPFIAYLYALLILVLGDGDWQVRFVDLLIVTSGVVALGYFLRPLTNSFVATICAIVFGLSLFQTHQMAAQSDGWLLVLIVYAMALIRWDNGRMLWRTALFMGVITAVILLSKFPFCLFLSIPAIYLYIAYKVDVKKWFLFHFVIGMLGIALTVIFCLITLSPEGFKEMIDIMFVYSPTFHRTAFVDFLELHSLSAFLVVLFSHLTNTQTFAPIVLFLLGMLTWRKQSLLGLLAFLWTLSVIAMVYVQLRPIGYYLLPIFMPLVLGMACLLWGVYRKNRFIVYLICLIMLGLQTNYHVSQSIHKGYAYIAGYVTEDEYRSTFPYFLHEPPTNLHVHRMTKYMKNNTPEGEKIMAFSYLPILYALTDRQSATRHGYDAQLYLSRGDRQTHYFSEVVDDLKQSRPLYIVRTSILHRYYVESGKAPTNRSLPFYYPFTGDAAIRKLIDDSYFFDISFGPFYIMRRHEQQQCYPQPHYMNYLGHRAKMHPIHIFPSLSYRGLRNY